MGDPNTLIPESKAFLVNVRKLADKRSQLRPEGNAEREGAVMITRKSFFIDTTKCTGCRGCQAACKQWNQNPATKTRQQGTYQNPPDLSTATFKLVRFNSGTGPSGDPEWYFFPDQCRHCIYPPCKMAADQKAPGAVILDTQTRAVIYDPAVKVSPEAFKAIRADLPV